MEWCLEKLTNVVLLDGMTSQISGAAQLKMQRPTERRFMFFFMHEM